MNDFLKDIIKETGNEYASLVADGVEAGDTDTFIDTGSYIFNALLSGSIYGGLPSNKITAIAGESATGKTFFLMGIVKNFLDANPESGVVYFESESAITKQMIIDFYSNRVTGIFLKLKDVCKRFPVETLTKSFVCAILYSMRKGVIIEDIPIIPQDYYLKSSLPQCNMLDAYGINKTHFTAASTTILVSLREAVLDGVNPHHLLVSSLH